MVDDIKKWQAEHLASIEAQLGTLQGITDYIEDTMDNFAHRYLVTSSGDPVDTMVPNPGFLAAESEEKNIEEAKKTTNQTVLKAITEKRPQSLRYILMCSVSDFIEGKGSGTLDIVGVVHWGGPEFLPASPDQDMRKVQFKFEDILDFRNNFAKYLEEACKVF